MEKSANAIMIFVYFSLGTKSIKINQQKYQFDYNIPYPAVGISEVRLY